MRCLPETLFVFLQWLKDRSRSAILTLQNHVRRILLQVITSYPFTARLQNKEPLRKWSWRELCRRSNGLLSFSGWIILHSKVNYFTKPVERKEAASYTPRLGQKISRSMHLQTILVQMNTKGLFGLGPTERKPWKKTIFSGERVCDEALQTLFKATYFTGKQSLPYSKFPALCKLLMSVNAPITSSMYQDEKACSDLIRCISVVIQKKIICRIQNSPFFGIMVDESTDISVTGHLVMFAIIVEEGLSKTIFLGLLQLDGGTKNSASIFYCVISHLRLWDLGLCNFVAFGSDGASIMVGSQTGVSTRIRKRGKSIPLSMSLCSTSHQLGCFGCCQNTRL